MMRPKLVQVVIAAAALVAVHHCALAASTQDQTPAAQAAIGGWRLVKTPGPKEQPQIVSIMHTADLLNSDPDLAGIMLRCRKSGGVQIGFVLVSPLPPRSTPEVSISGAASQMTFQGEPIAPGTIIALPVEAEALLNGPWTRARTISVQIRGGGGRAIHGVVPTDHLPEALAVLRQNCREY